MAVTVLTLLVAALVWSRLVATVPERATVMGSHGDLVDPLGDRVRRRLRIWRAVRREVRFQRDVERMMAQIEEELRRRPRR